MSISLIEATLNKPCSTQKFPLNFRKFDWQRPRYILTLYVSFSDTNVSSNNYVSWGVDSPTHFLYFKNIERQKEVLKRTKEKVYGQLEIIMLPKIANLGAKYLALWTNISKTRRTCWKGGGEKGPDIHC